MKSYITNSYLYYIQDIIMNKWLKIILYAILILTIIAVVWLMFGNTNPNVETQNDTDVEIYTWENLEEITDTTEIETNSFEEDVMKDLEWFFGTNNGYEDVEWEYWFNNPENE